MKFGRVVLKIREQTSDGQTEEHHNIMPPMGGGVKILIKPVSFYSLDAFQFILQF